MICPQCGYDMGTKSKCLRCGYEVKTLVFVSEEERKKREQAETKVIDPSNTYITDEYGYSVDDDEFGDPLSTLFDGLFGFDPFADLLGGLFGIDVHPQRSKRTERVHAKQKKDDNIVEVNKVEIIDENGKKTKQKSSSGKHKRDK